MKKKLLSIITSASLLVSAFSFGVNAAPSAAGQVDSGLEYIPVPEISFDNSAESDNSLASVGPQAVTVTDTAEETNTEFGTPESWGDAVLFADLSGEGTKESPYLIGNADELKLMADNINSGIGNKAYYKLTSDIDLGGSEWTPIGHYNEIDKYGVSFCGTFDGDGHTVSNFKITKDNTLYLGFFGLVSGGSVKNFNIDGAVININSASTQRLYVGALVGRLVTTENESRSSIENCNVANSSVTAKSNGTIYAGGLAGSAVSGAFKNASIFIAFSTSQCDIDISTYALNQFYNTQTGMNERQMVVAGNLIGYLSAQTDSTITIINCSANGNVSSSALNSLVSQPMNGGAFGDVRTVDISGKGGTININSCYSEGTVTAMSDFYPYIAGGFAGQIYATQNLFITDCYSSSDVNGKYLQAGNTRNDDPTGGGFAGQIFFPDYSSSYGKTIKRCYGSGDVVDLTHTETTPKDYSFVGGFMGWTTAGIFESCYRFDSQNLWGSDANFTDYNFITSLSDEEAKLLDKYTGFDFVNTWELNQDAEYFYPTLREKIGYVNFIAEGNVSFATAVFGTDGRVSAPSGIPTKASTVDKVFSFNYWSLSRNGSAFNFGGDTLSESTTLYAVFTSVPRQYNVTFMSEGSVVGSVHTLDFGSAVKAPSVIPTKPDSSKYYYTFLYWSDAENGQKFDFTDCTVVGDMTFYAVFEEIDKSAWTGGVAEKFESGFGTEALPYIIKTSDEFALFAKVINEQQSGYTNAYYALGADINLGGKLWVPIGNSTSAPFSANFDGRGYSVGNFKLTENKYAGLFGYVLNGTIKNLYVTNFEINLSPNSTVEKDSVYVGGLAGYITSNRGISNISGIRVSALKFNIDASINYVFAGNIAGYASAYVLGNTYISDSFATSDITVKNVSGYSYLGGLIGRFDTGSGSKSLISNCYNVGSLTSTSYHSSRVGGLVGYLYSYGSAYAPEPGQVSGDTEEKTAELAAEDVDIMIENSFAVANVSSYSTEYTSYVGRICGEVNTHAAAKNVFYVSSVTFSPAEKEYKVGALKDVASLKTLTYLSSSLSFDFDNTWTFASGYDFPVLKCMVSDKPELNIVSTSFIDNTLNATVQVLANVDEYTIIIGVYNARNQLIKAERIGFTYTGSVAEFNICYENLKNAEYIALSAVEKNSLTPLFEGVKQDI